MRDYLSPRERQSGLCGGGTRTRSAKHGHEDRADDNSADEDAAGDCPIPEGTAIDHRVAARRGAEVEHGHLVARAIARRIAADAVLELDRLVFGGTKAYDGIVGEVTAAARARAPIFLQ